MKSVSIKLATRNWRKERIEGGKGRSKKKRSHDAGESEKETLEKGASSEKACAQCAVDYLEIEREA